MVAATKHTFDEHLGSGVFPSDLKDLGLPYFCLYTDYTVLKPWTSHAPRAEAEPPRDIPSSSVATDGRLDIQPCRRYGGGPLGLHRHLLGTVLDRTAAFDGAFCAGHLLEQSHFTPRFGVRLFRVWSIPTVDTRVGSI